MLGDGVDAVVALLRRQEALVALDKNYTHRYPYDWRTKKPIILRASTPRFIDSFISTVISAVVSAFVGRTSPHRNA